MTVYVDVPMFRYRGHLYCHVWADDVAELHLAAKAAGLRRTWFQEPPKAQWQHYDAGPRARAKLIANGAVVTDRYGALEFLARQRGRTDILDRIARLRGAKAANPPDAGHDMGKTANQQTPLDLPDLDGATLAATVPPADGWIVTEDDKEIQLWVGGQIRGVIHSWCDSRTGKSLDLWPVRAGDGKSDRREDDLGIASSLVEAALLVLKHANVDPADMPMLPDLLEGAGEAWPYATGRVPTDQTAVSPSPPATTTETVFINEYGRTITASVRSAPFVPGVDSENAGGVIIRIEGPTSLAEDTYTPVEAAQLHQLLDRHFGRRGLPLVPGADGPRLPKDPPPGLLMSMALRFDHGLGCPGFYDQPMFQATGLGTHAQRLAAALDDARRAYEEIAGFGFYAPAREAAYAVMADMAAAGPAPGPGIRKGEG